jgi:hypothetical protein
MAEFPNSRDLNQWQKLLVDMAAGFAGHTRPTRKELGKEPATVSADGLKSDNALAEKLSPEEQLALARKAVQARWNRPASDLIVIEVAKGRRGFQPRTKGGGRATAA